MTGSAALRYGFAALLAAALAGAAWYAWKTWSAAKSQPAWRTAQVERGPIIASVSATGTLNPVRSVQVGSQVSGQIKEMYVDFNDVVKQGQMLARIDPESFELKVRQAMADVEAARATVATQQAAVGAQRAAVSREEVNVAEARRDLGRKQMLADKGFISASERDRAAALVNTSQEQLKTVRAQLSVSEAQAKNAEAVVKQREAQLAQTKVDLERTAIRAPSDGVIIKRSVDAGQTVAASLQAPELFIIARNLTDMQVDASIDEAEVGRLRLGQRATFAVDSFPGRIFSGEVLQVRKSARVVQNVVTYIVVIGALNPDQSLLPGMTANVRVVTEQRENVLKVPNAALRFRPAGFVEAPAAAGRPPAGPKKGGSVAAALPTSQQSGAGDAGIAGLIGAQAPLRQRLAEDLKLDAAQQTRLDAALAAQRQRLAGVRQLSAAERGPALAKNRAELRAQISEFLRPEQKRRFEEIMAELAAPARAGRAAAEGAKEAPSPGARGAGKAPGSPRGEAAAPATQFRQRLVDELKMDAAQQARLDEVLSAQRVSPQALRRLSPADRSKAAERNRAELRMQIYEILRPEQRRRYGEIMAETAGRQAARGRIFVLDDKGQPRAVNVRLGLSDGSMTEVLGGDLEEGQGVLIGALVGAAPKAGRTAGKAAPGLRVTP